MYFSWSGSELSLLITPKTCQLWKLDVNLDLLVSCKEIFKHFRFLENFTTTKKKLISCWSRYVQRTLIDDSWKFFAKLALLWPKRSSPRLQIPWKMDLNRKNSFLWGITLFPHATIELTGVACSTANAIACLIICSKESTLNFFHFIKSSASIPML